MKILGHASIPKRVEHVTIGVHPTTGAPLTIEVRPVPFGVAVALEDELPAPKAPIVKGQVKRHPKTKAVVKDADGSPVPVRDFSDKRYLRDLEMRETALSVALVFASVGEQLEPRERRDDETPQDYYLALLDELCARGLDSGIFGSLSQAAKRLNRPMSPADIARMRTQVLGTATVEQVSEERDTAEQEAEKAAQAGNG